MELWLLPLLFFARKTMLLTNFFKNHYRPKRLFGKSENTTRLYLVSIRNFGRTLGRDAMLGDLTDANVMRHMEAMVSRGRSKATANKDRAQILTMWRYAFIKKMASRSPDVQAYPEPERVPVAWMPEEVNRILDSIDATTGDYCGCPRSLWWRTLVMVALDTGERIGAISQAKRCWLTGNQILFPAEARKGGKRDRIYRLSDETTELLRLIMEHRNSESIFHFPFNSTYMWSHYREIVKRSGLPHGRRDMFHKLRRTTGSAAYAAGLDPQDVLDHQHRRTTQRYLDPRVVKKEQPCDILAAYLANPRPQPEAKRRSG